MKELNELVELAKKASPGKWSCSPYNTGARFCAQVWDESDKALLLHDGKGERASNDVAFIAAANPQTILAIAEAFRAMQQEKEAPEAKLAELENQEPSALRWRFHHGRDLPAMAWTYIDNKKYFDGVRAMEGTEVHEVFTRPAPAFSLAELVPDSWSWGEVKDFCYGLDVTVHSRACYAVDKAVKAYRAAILRKIEEVK